MTGMSPLFLSLFSERLLERLVVGAVRALHADLVVREGDPMLCAVCDMYYV